MAKTKTIILTPHSDFGDIVKQTLSKVACLDVNVSSSPAEADRSIRDCTELGYALLDLELGIYEVLRQGFQIREKFPAARLVLISKRNPPLELDELRPWTVLRKPFSQRELFSIFRDEDQTPQKEPDIIDLHFNDIPGGALPAWLGDGERAVKTLNAAMANLDAQEAMIFSNENLLTHSGSLHSGAITECSELLGKALKDNQEKEIIMPVHLETDKQNHLLHITILAVGIILALAYADDTPYHIVRSQTRYLTSILKNPQIVSNQNQLLPDRIKSNEVKMAALLGLSEATQTKRKRKPIPSARTMQVRQAYRARSSHEMMDEQNGNYNLHGKIEPWMGKKAYAADEQPLPLHGRFSSEHNKGMHTHAIRPGRARGFSLSVSDSRRFDVYYACALIPRIKSQFLEGHLEEYLRIELPNIFLAYGWRLEELDIDPAYLQWRARIPPTLSPAAHIGVIRKQSSRMILDNFNNLNRNGLLHDFWAPGYLLGSGQDCIAEEEICEFIRANRMQHYTEENLKTNYRKFRSRME